MSRDPRVDIRPAVIESTCYEFREDKFGGPSCVLSDLTAVGPEKPVGYIPVNSLKSYYRVDVNRLIDLLEKAGINTAILTGEQHRGAACLYAYDREALAAVLEEERAIVESYGWSIDPDDFVRRVEDSSVPLSDELFRVIARTFGDPISLEMWCDYQETGSPPWDT